MEPTGLETGLKNIRQDKDLGLSEKQELVQKLKDETLKELLSGDFKVEWKKLADIGYFYGGLSGKSKADFKNGNAPFVSYVNVFNNIATNTEPSDMVSVSAGEKQNNVLKGDILFTGSSETREECGMASAVVSEPKGTLYLNSFCFGFRVNESVILIPEFSKHLFRSIGMRKRISRMATGATRFNLSRKKLIKLEVPIPPLHIQKKTADILDMFTELEAELEAELVLRKKQYEYYREQLLDFNRGGYWEIVRGLDLTTVEWKKLGESLKTASGYKKVQTRKKLDGHLYPVIDQGQSYSAGFLDNKDLLFPRNNSPVIIFGDHTRQVKYINEDFIPGADGTKIITVYTDCSMRYGYHVMKDLVDTGKLPNLGYNRHFVKLKEIICPIPPKAIQDEIVQILDKFDCLTNDLSAGLPGEIKQRRQQYEYYREMLLTF